MKKYKKGDGECVWIVVVFIVFVLQFLQLFSQNHWLFWWVLLFFREALKYYFEKYK